MAKFLRVNLKWADEFEGLSYDGDEHLPDHIDYGVDGDFIFGADEQELAEELIDDICEGYGWVVLTYDFEVVEKGSKEK